MFVRLKKIGDGIWTHKKKTMFAGVVLYWAGDWAMKARRTLYAKEAIVFGEQPISAEGRPRRITVLGNTSANERHVWDAFTKNALPLFHLAGMQVNVIKTESEEELAQLASVLDATEADGIFVVGGDGTMQRTLTAVYKDRQYAPLPMGFAPGGYDNLALKSLVPTVFGEEGDVRRWCESAMAVIEDTRREVSVIQSTLTIDENSPQIVEYGISPVYAGWMGHIEERRRKLWYWGRLKRRFAYFWEMVKRSPQPLDISLQYEEFCAGCAACRHTVISKPPWRWWHVLTGTPKNVNKGKQKDYSKIVNEGCGRKHSTTMAAVELNVYPEQMDDSCRLHLSAVSGLGRMGVMREGWKRCATGDVAESPSQGFYDTILTANSFSMHFNSIPAFLSRVYLAGDSKEAKDGSTLSVSTTLKKAQLFLPKSLRVNIDEL